MSIPNEKDAPSTFYLQVNGVGHMVKTTQIPLPPFDSLFVPISSNGSFYMQPRTDRIAQTTVFVTQVARYWLEREMAQCIHHTGSIRRPIEL